MIGEKMCKASPWGDDSSSTDTTICIKQPEKRCNRNTLHCMMGETTKSYVPSEILLTKLKTQLRKDSIKLWTNPYSGDDGSQQIEVLTQLAIGYAEMLKQPIDVTLLGLQHLHQHSIERLAQNSKYRSENVATLRLKFSQKSVSNIVTSIETSLDITGQNLMNVILEKVGLRDMQLKLVCRGKIIKPNETVLDQGVQHNSTVLCIMFSTENDGNMREMEKQMEKLRSTRRGAELLASSSNAAVQEQYDAHITDQSGRTINIPPHEKGSLIVALSLHEKGRAILARKDYTKALLYLLEADNDFQKCSPELLKLVDNFAILCMDISWCYLRLKNLDALPDVEDRLKTCESFFNSSYGKNLQRLYSIKGNTGEEVALFIRLYTLQGIVAFHNENYSLSKEILKKAQGYINTLKVEEDKLLEMVNLGFTLTEGTYALRACDGNVASATQYAYQKREEREQIAKSEKESARKRQLARSLGQCENGEDVDVDVYENLVEKLGFDKSLAAEALRQCNNDLDKAIETIHTNPELLNVGKHQEKITTDDIKQVAAMGFDLTSAHAALHHFEKDKNLCLDYLLSHNGLVPADWLEALPKSKSLSSMQLSHEDAHAVKKLARVVEKQDCDPNTLTEETEYIEQYLAMLESINF